MLTRNGLRYMKCHLPQALTITVLRQVFAAYGLPDCLVSDNGLQFVSEEFRSFLRVNGIKHLQSAPYHPATNGAAERFVQTLKRAIVMGRKDSRSDKHKLASFLLKYRSTPHDSTGVAPSELFLGRSLKTVLDLLRPDVSREVMVKQSLQKEGHDQHCCTRQLEPGDLVMVRSYLSGHIRWVPGEVTSKFGPVSYQVKLSDGVTKKCHIDQLQRRSTYVSSSTEEEADLKDPSASFTSELEVPSPSQEDIPSTSLTSSPSQPSSSSLPSSSPLSSSASQPASSSLPLQPSPSAPPSSPRYPTRVRKPPDRYSDTNM